MRRETSFFSKAWFFLLALAGAAVLSPFVQMHGPLATGDHGRDLYAFAHAWQSSHLIPYRDYWWVYGPLMPYYYGLWMKLLGPSVLAVMIGKTALLLVAGLFLALAVRTATASRLVAAGAGLWFWISFDDAMCTYNHTGGIVCVAALVLALVSWISERRRSALLAGLAAIAVLSLVKLNMGLAALAAFALAVTIDNQRKDAAVLPSKYLLWTAITLLPVAGIYALLLHGLQPYEIHQSFPYGAADQQHLMSPLRAVVVYGKHFLLTLNVPAFLLAIAVILSGLRFLWLVLPRGRNAFSFPAGFIGIVGSLSVLFIALLHEYLVSGILYRFSWAQPVWIALLFILIGWASASLTRIWRSVIYVSLFIVLALAFVNRIDTRTRMHTAAHLWNDPRAMVYVDNDRAWIDAVNATANYLRAHLRRGETFLALPYDPIYYFLTDRIAPTRQTIFFKHINMPAEQERRIIDELERNHVNWVLISTRYLSPEPGLGHLGRDYGQLLFTYLKEKFAPAVRFGNWQEGGAWAKSHGTLLLKRKDLLP